MSGQCKVSGDLLKVDDETVHHVASDVAYRRLA